MDDGWELRDDWSVSEETGPVTMASGENGASSCYACSTEAYHEFTSAPPSEIAPSSETTPSSEPSSTECKEEGFGYCMDAEGY